MNARVQLSASVGNFRARNQYCHQNNELALERVALRCGRAVLENDRVDASGALSASPVYAQRIQMQGDSMHVPLDEALA